MTLKIAIRSRFDSTFYEGGGIESHIALQNPKRCGRAIVRTCLGGFEVNGPKGKYVVLCRGDESLLGLQRCFVDCIAPVAHCRDLHLPFLNGLVLFLQCKLVHTGKF